MPAAMVVENVKILVFTFSPMVKLFSDQSFTQLERLRLMKGLFNNRGICVRKILFLLITCFSGLCDTSLHAQLKGNLNELNANICNHWKKVSECSICRTGGADVFDGKGPTLQDLPTTLYLDPDEAAPPKPNTPVKKPTYQPPATPVKKTYKPGKTTQPSSQPVKKVPVQRRPGEALPIEEPTEFWSPEEKEFINSALTGLGIVGGCGVGIYVLLQGLGLLGAKAGTTAAIGAAGAQTGYAATTTAGMAGETLAEAIPQIGDSRSYVDENGSRWVEVFNGQNWIDSASHSASQAQATDNQAWQNEQFERQAKNDTAFDRQLSENAERHAAEREAIRETSRNHIKDINKTLQELAESAQRRAEITLEAKEFQLKWLERGKTVIDCLALPVMGAFTGPAGLAVSTASTLASDIAAGSTEGIINAGSTSEAIVEGIKGGLTGAATGTVSILVGEGLNSVAAVGSTAARKFCSGIVLRTPGKAVPKILHHDSTAAETITTMWKNFGQGKSITEGLMKKAPVMPKQLGIRMNRVNSAAFEKRAWEISNFKDARKAENLSNSIWGTASAVKSYFIDRNVSNYVNQSLFTN